MDPTVTFLLSFGLSLNCVIRGHMDILPRPTLWADPNPVVPKGAYVTLRCQRRLRAHIFQLWKDGQLREEKRESEHLAEFVLRDVDDERDARSYSCRYGQGSLWSEFSEPLELVVMTGELLRPSISISPGSTIDPETTVTISCQRSRMDFSQEYNFILLEGKSLETLQQQSSVGTQANFSIQSVRAEDTGSYSCIYYQKTAPYRGSHPSESLLVTVLGLLSKPTLWAQPGFIVDAGTNITLWCSRPKLSSLGAMTFALCKERTQKALELQRLGESWTGFLLPSVRPEDTGSYSCSYRGKIYPDLALSSIPSDALELIVPGSLPRPSLSALPGFVVEPGTHVTLQCRQPPQSSLWKVTFILLKQGSPKPLQTQSPAGPSADFHLFSVRAQDAGNYSCVYHGTTVPYQVSEISEVLEISVTVSQPSTMVLSGSIWTQCNKTLISVLSCVSFLFLCLLLLVLLFRQSIPMESIQEDNSRRFFCCPCLPWGASLPPNPDILREDAMYVEVTKERSRELSVSVDKVSQEVTYTQLNIRALNKRKRDPMDRYIEPTLYATVSDN